MEEVQMIKNVLIADSNTKGYKFVCSNSPNVCHECGAALTNFITQNIEEAYNHSLRNSVAMWIHKD